MIIIIVIIIIESRKFEHYGRILVKREEVQRRMKISDAIIASIQSLYPGINCVYPVAVIL